MKAHSEDFALEVHIGAVWSLLTLPITKCSVCVCTHIHFPFSEKRKLFLGLLSLIIMDIFRLVFIREREFDHSLHM